MIAQLEVRSLIVVRSTDFTLQLPLLKLGAGKILCIAGPNGSGKTTLIEALAGIIPLTNGEVRLAGRPLTAELRDIRGSIGFIPDSDEWFVGELTAGEFFELTASVYRQAGHRLNLIGRARDLAQELYFTSFDQTLDSLSHGNKKKVEIIAGLMHAPSLIIIDELRNGLDPLAIIAAERIIKREASRGASIIAATHDLWWAERFSDSTLLLVDGREVVQSATKQLIAKWGSLESLFLDAVGEGVRK